jgi:hypothetical protein
MRADLEAAADFTYVRVGQNGRPFAIPDRNEKSAVQLMPVQQRCHLHVGWVAVISRASEHDCHGFILAWMVSTLRKRTASCMRSRFFGCWPWS